MIVRSGMFIKSLMNTRTKISPETDLFLLRAFIVFLPQLLKNIPHKRELLSATQEDIDKAKLLIYNVRKQI